MSKKGASYAYRLKECYRRNGAGSSLWYYYPITLHTSLSIYACYICSPKYGKGPEVDEPLSHGANSLMR